MHLNIWQVILIHLLIYYYLIIVRQSISNAERNWCEIDVEKSCSLLYMGGVLLGRLQFICIL